MLIVAALIPGCTKQTPAPVQTQVSSAERKELNTTVFEWIATVLNDLRSRESAHGMEQIINRLNHWTADRPPETDWQVDPLINELPEEYRRISTMRDLETLIFRTNDGLTLREAVWLRDTSREVAGDQQNELDQSVLLFDWVVRNIQLEPDAYTQTPFESGEVLLLGRGSAADRAWIFMLLLRQVGLDAAIIEPAAKESASEETGDASFQPKIVGVMIDENLYLFDVALGLPIPGPNGKGVATIEQAAADDSIFRSLDLDAEQPYPLSADDFHSVRAFVEASPSYLTKRMHLIGSQLSGDQRIVFSTRPSAVIERLKEHAQIREAGLWSVPFERRMAIEKLASTPDAAEARERFRLMQPFMIMFQIRGKTVPALQTGRMRHLMADYGGQGSAVEYYQAARMTDEQIVELVEAQIRAGLWREDQFNVGFDIATRGKQNATYWLGLMALERERYSTAVDYLRDLTLKTWPNGPWTPGARYNLGRALEGMGESEAAIEAYRSTEAPQRYGALLRAKQLEAGDAD